VVQNEVVPRIAKNSKGSFAAAFKKTYMILYIDKFSLNWSGLCRT